VCALQFDDVTPPRSFNKQAEAIKDSGGPVDILINNAGYFYGPCESVLQGSMNFDEEMKQINICAVGPLRITSASKTHYPAGIG